MLARETPPHGFRRYAVQLLGGFVSIGALVALALLRHSVDNLSWSPDVLYSLSFLLLIAFFLGMTLVLFSERRAVHKRETRAGPPSRDPWTDEKAPDAPKPDYEHRLARFLDDVEPSDKTLPKRSPMGFFLAFLPSGRFRPKSAAYIREILERIRRRLRNGNAH